jgi:hypothetical protein
VWRSPLAVLAGRLTTLEPGKSVEGASWADRAAAEAEVEASRRRLQETQEPG